MDAFTRDDLKLLLEPRTGSCVSVFVPTHRAGPEVQGNAIRFKNLLRSAEGQLQAAGMRSSESREFMTPLAAFLGDSHFWQHQADGLAVFRASDFVRAYRLPVTVPELAVVAETFHLKPLLPLLSEDGGFHVLAISQNSVRLFRGTRQLLDEVELEGVPRSLDEALQYDDPQRQLQFHTGAPAAGGRRAAIFHGGGGGVDDAKDNVLRFFQLVDKGLRPILRGDRVPLILAAVEFLHPLYRQATTHGHVMDVGLRGNPDDLTAQELHSMVLPRVEAYFGQEREAATARYHQLAGTGRTGRDLAEVLIAAHAGRVDTLFVAVGRQRWGSVDFETGLVRLQDQAGAGVEDLLNVAAVHVLASGGAVFAVPSEEVPGDNGAALLAAVYRY
jgi:hypothetical protein